MEFFRTFVDEDLALTVGVAYWFTYAITFAALTTALAGELNATGGIAGAILFFLVPAILVFLNSLGVSIYAFTELAGGSL